MWEQSKSAKRRYNDGPFHSRYFVGSGIDIGGAPDPLNQYTGVFRNLDQVKTWDLDDGDAQLMSGVSDNSFDFVHSSHCLEHMVEPREALKNWIRIVKPGGFLIITVPDEDLYEQGHWPSHFNSDHKWTFTTFKSHSWSPKSINLVDLCAEFGDTIEVERMILLQDFFREDFRKQGMDQTRTPVAECGIEIIWRKRETAQSDANSSEQISNNRLAQLTYERLDSVRDIDLPHDVKELPHSVVIPQATYSPWALDKNFLSAYSLTTEYSSVCRYRSYELWQLVNQTAHLKGDFLDIGLCNGGTTLIIAKAMKMRKLKATLYLAGVSTGKPKTETQSDGHTDAPEECVQDILNQNRIKNMVLLQGLFPSEAADKISGKLFRFCHVNSDTSQSTKEVFEWIWPRLVPGGIVIFNDYGTRGCEEVTRQVNELQTRKDLFFLHNLNGHGTCIKLSDD